MILMIMRFRLVKTIPKMSIIRSSQILVCLCRMLSLSNIYELFRNTYDSQYNEYK